MTELASPSRALAQSVMCTAVLKGCHSRMESLLSRWICGDTCHPPCQPRHHSRQQQSPAASGSGWGGRILSQLWLPSLSLPKFNSAQAYLSRMQNYLIQHAPTNGLFCTTAMMKLKNCSPALIPRCLVSALLCLERESDSSICLRLMYHYSNDLEINLT